MSTLRWLALLPILSGPTVVSSQPTLESLWPNAGGMHWEYAITVEEALQPGFSSTATLDLAGTVQTPGGPAQELVAAHGFGPKTRNTGRLDPLMASVWRARPDLRRAIEARYGKPSTAGMFWWPLLLHGGYFMKTAASIQMWQADWDHPTWTYLTADLTVGATFTHQLVPELADDVFLHGTVEAVDATVATGAGMLQHAVRMGYVVDYGWYDGTDDMGQVRGRIRSETRGHVHYVPDVGPAEMREDFVPYVEIECVPCPPEWVDGLGRSFMTIDLSLSRLPVVAVAATSWSRIKSMYQ